jgi:hypothetical protein
MSNWHFERDGRIVGPFTARELRGLRDVGWIGSETQLVNDQGDVFRACEILEFNNGPLPTCEETDSPFPADVPSASPSDLSRKPLSSPNAGPGWDPRWIAGLGFLFSPLWAAAMAVLNGRRLGKTIPPWRPFLIGLGPLVTLPFAWLLGIPSLLMAVMGFVGSLWILWKTELEPQAALFDAAVAQPGTSTSSGSSWRWPVLLGLPAVLVVFVVFVILPLWPMSPRTVCDRFARVSRTTDAKPFTTSNLWPALDAMALFDDETSKETIDVDVLSEGPATSPQSGSLIRCRIRTTTPTETNTLEAVFQLVDGSGRWKIDDVTFLSFNGQSLPEPLSLARDYEQLVSGARETGSLTTRAASSAPQATAVKPLTTPAALGTTKMLAWGLFRSGLVQKAGLIGLAAAAWFWSTIRRRR